MKKEFAYSSDDDSQKRLEAAEVKVSESKRAAAESSTLLAQRLNREAQIRLLAEIDQGLTLKRAMQDQKLTDEFTFYQDYSYTRIGKYLVGAGVLLPLAAIIVSSITLHLAKNDYWGPIGQGRYSDSGTFIAVADRIRVGATMGDVFGSILFVITLASFLYLCTFPTDNKNIRSSFDLIDHSANEEARNKSAVPRMDWEKQHGAAGLQAALSFLNAREAKKEEELKVLQGQQTMVTLKQN